MDSLTYYFNKKLFTIQIKRTNNKNMYLKVKGDTVYCSAPMLVTDKNIKTFVDEHAEKFFQYIQNTKSNMLYSLNDNFIFIFGKKYRIKRLTGVKKTKIEYGENSLYIYAIDNDDERIEKILKKLLKDSLREYAILRQKYFEKLMNIPHHEIRFIFKTTNWGSNSVQSKRISYSTKLAHFKHEVIDYVIVHELSHHVQPNHSSKFWDIVEKNIPNYKKLRKELRADTTMS